MRDEDRRFLIGLFDAAVHAADPRLALAAHMPKPPKGRTIVIGAGKGSAQLAAAFEKLWQGPLEGVVVTRYGFGCPTTKIKVLEASHPVPDEAGLRASHALFDAVKNDYIHQLPHQKSSERTYDNETTLPQYTLISPLHVRDTTTLLSSNKKVSRCQPNGSRK